MRMPANTFALNEVSLSNRGSDLPYLVVTIRVASQAAIQCKELAQNLGWQLPDFPPPCDLAIPNMTYAVIIIKQYLSESRA